MNKTEKELFQVTCKKTLYTLSGIYSEDKRNHK